jgi:hypothetical protein
MCSVTMSSPLWVDIVGVEKNSTSVTSEGHRDILPRLKPGASQATHSISSIVDA